MKIRCIRNIGKDIPQEILKDYCSPDSNIPLILGKEYVVYAISEYYDNIWYCICDESYSYYPMWIPFPFFEISDNHLSRYWIFSFKQDKPKNRPFFGFPEWALEQVFYDNLTDGADREVALFKAYKELMDLEFPDSFISQAAQIGDDRWLICPVCFEAWEDYNKLDGMVKCPKCNTILHNPRNENEYFEI